MYFRALVLLTFTISGWVDGNSDLFPIGTENYVIMAPAYRFPRDGDYVSFQWESFMFYLYEVQDDERNCDHQALEVSYETTERDGRFMVVQIAKVGCNIDKESLNIAVKKESDDTLIYRLQNNQCYKATYKWRRAPMEEAIEKFHVKYECSDLVAPTANSKIIKDNKSAKSSPAAGKEESKPSADETKSRWRESGSGEDLQ